MPRRDYVNPSGGGTRTSRVSGPTRRAVSPTTRNEGGKGLTGWRKALPFVNLPTIPFYLASKTGIPGVSHVGRAGSALTSSLIMSLANPKATTRDAYDSFLGLWEGPYATYKSIRREGLADTADIMWEGIKQDYADRYGANWENRARDDSLFNLFDTLIVLGPTARATAMGAALPKIQAAGKPANLMNLWREASRPGLISEGTPKLRRIEYTSPVTGETEFTERFPSRSPLRRGSQTLTDIASQRYPHIPVFGARSRVSRGQARTLQRNFDRLLGSVVGVESLNKLSDAGRSRLFWASQIGDNSDSGLRSLREALRAEFHGDHRPDTGDDGMDEWLWQAKQAGFGEQLLSKLDAAIEYKPDDTFDRAMDSMRMMTELTENVIADADGFTSIRNDLLRAEDRLRGLDPKSDAARALSDDIDSMRAELASKEGELRSMFDSRRSRVREWLDAQKFTDTPERAAWLERLTDLLGEEQAQTAIRLADALSNTWENPASWWAERAGTPTGEGAEAFMGRDPAALFQRGEQTREWGEGQRPLITTLGDAESVIEGHSPHSLFYSPLQKWVDDMPAKPMQRNEMESQVRKEIGDDEFYNAGMDTFFNQYGKTDRISKQELLNHLANRLNAYNLLERHLINSAESLDPSGGTKYDLEYDGLYVSREPAYGEYHEVFFALPRLGRDPTPYEGTAFTTHWFEQNVVVHFRFHVFNEDGKTKLLIEEIQSDWAGDFRKQTAKGIEYQEMTPEMRAEVARLEAESNHYSLLLHERRRAVAEMDQRANDPDITAEEYDAMSGEYYAAMDDIDRILDTMRSIDFEIENVQPGEIPRPPISGGMSKKSSYINAPIRWMLRYAAENDVDEVIVVDRRTQLVRNAKALDPRSWQDLRDGDALDVTAWLDEQGPHPNRAYIGYAEDIPRRISEEMDGVEGEWKLAAYNGGYKVNFDNTSWAPGAMPGIVFPMTEGARAAAMKPKRLYQRSPEWNKLPKGATELLEGRTLIHLFENADVSTWIHELGHVAIHDLSDADQSVLNAHYAGGRLLDSWKEMEHESFARDWERYVREGNAPTRALEPLFARLSAWMKAIWQAAEEKHGEELPPEIRQVFDSMFRNKTPDIFVPHRAGTPDLAGGRTSKGIPRANRDIGDRAFSRIPLFKRNQLALMRSGMLNDDPRVMVEHVNRLLMLARANQLREAVLQMGKPLLPGEYPDFETQYVVKRAGRGVDKPLYDALEAAENPAEIRQTVKDFIDNHVGDSDADYQAWVGESQLYVVDKRVVDMLFKNVTGRTPGAVTKPAGAAGQMLDAGLDSLRALLLYANPGFYMSNMIGNMWMAVTQDPRSLRHLGWSMSNAIKAATQPHKADHLWEQISVEMGRGPTSGGVSMRPAVLGQGRQRGGPLAGRVAENVSYGLSRWGRRSGRVIDDSFRVAAWKQAAAKRGYTTDEKIQKLLDLANADRRLLDTELRGPKGAKKRRDKRAVKARRELEGIRDEAENLMLDFDSLTPWERTWLQRLIFLYPFLRASVKYPFAYVGERPTTAGVLGAAGLQQERFATEILGEREELPAWAEGYARGPGGYMNVGSFAPWAMPLDVAQSLAGLGQPTEIGVNRPYAYSNPAWQLAISLSRSQNRYGRDASAPEIVRSDFPMPAYLAQALRMRKPSERYKDRDLMDTLIRSLRVVPFEMEEGE